MIRFAVFTAFAIFAGNAGAEPRWDFVVRLDPASETLELRGCSDRAIDELRLRAGDTAGAHLRELHRAGGVGLAVNGGAVRARSWRPDAAGQ